ncbi:MAG: nitronate monooxygenase [Rhodospirillales bacterium]|nr:nitronate monooxygenase [Rhodospirillales bacterium]
MWPDTAIIRLFGTAVPIVQAPMAGEPDRAELTAAVSNAGGLGSAGVAYLQPDAIRERIHAIRALTQRPFGVNLFAPVTSDMSPAKIARARELLAPLRTAYGLDDMPAVTTMPDFEAQLAVVLEEKPAVLSFTFGCPTPEQIRRVRAAGIVAVGSATTVPEAQALEAAGVNAVVAQGTEAGAHRGSFLAPFDDGLIGLMALVPAMVDRMKIPVIAAGGIMDGRGIAAALMLGATGVQLGTAFLVSEESGASASWKNAILELDSDHTRVTPIYSGRPARGIQNTMMEILSPFAEELPGFPAMNSLTRAIRVAAAKGGDPDGQSLWAGQAAPLARAMPAGDLLRILSEETGRRLDEGFRG